MTPPGFLSMLDDLLARGIAHLSAGYIARQVRWAAARQRPDGGFPGRGGESDLYYTDFAVRLLALLAPGHEALRCAARCLACLPPAPRDVLDCVNRLNLARLLARGGPDCIGVAPPAILVCLSRQRLPDGGFARPGGRAVSAYHTFLAALCYEMLALPFPCPDAAVRQLAGLRCPDGGYGETPGEPSSQTSATAAAVAFFLMQDALPPLESASAAAFLAGTQAPDGGLRAHGRAPAGDLLSTFTGMTALGAMGLSEGLDLPAIARFIKMAAAPSGGFRACPGDPEADLEYTYYGIATLALLRTWLEAEEDRGHPAGSFPS